MSDFCYPGNHLVTSFNKSAQGRWVVSADRIRNEHILSMRSVTNGKSQSCWLAPLGWWGWLWINSTASNWPHNGAKCYVILCYTDCCLQMFKITFDLENSYVKVMAKVKPIGHIWGLELNRCLLFVLWQSDHFWLRYSKFHIWPWNFKVKVMAKVKSDGHIWGLEFNRYVCFSFRGNGTIFDRDIANSIFDLENTRSKSWPRSNLMVTFEA